MSNKTKESFQQILGRMDGLPSIPSSLSRILEALDNPDSSASDLAAALKLDQSVAARVLKMVNSAYFGFPRSIDTIQQAVTILGFRSIRDLVVISSLFNVVDRNSGRTSLDREGFWRHAVACGVAAKSIAQRTGVSRGEEIFLAGLLHDIGKVLLDAYLHEEYHEVLETAKRENLMLFEAEKLVLGASHTDFGQWLANEWKLPYNLTAGVAYHHNPTACPDHYILACLVHVSDVLVQALEIGHSGERLIPAIDPQAWASLHLTETLLEQIIPEFEEELDTAQALLPG